MTWHTADSCPTPKRALLNGQELKHCVAANPEKGKAVVHKMSPNGGVKVHKYGKRVLTKTLHGNVEVQF